MDFFGLKRNGPSRQGETGPEGPDRTAPQGPAVRPLTLPNGQTIQVVRDDVMRAALAAGKVRTR